MTLSELIHQLESLKEHCEELIMDSNDIWFKDVEALNKAIKILVSLRNSLGIGVGNGT